MDAIEAIQRRTSVRRFRPDPVPRETIELLLDCAVRAPNHKLTEPWRFAVLTGEARPGFAEHPGPHRLKRYDDPAIARGPGGHGQAAAGDAGDPGRHRRHGPGVTRTSSTREEDYAAVMMATANLMTAAQSFGLGTYLKTGGIMRVPALGDWSGCRRVSGSSASFRWAIPRRPSRPGGAGRPGSSRRWLDEAPAGVTESEVFEVFSRLAWRPPGRLSHARRSP